MATMMINLYVDNAYGKLKDALTFVERSGEAVSLSLCPCRSTAGVSAKFSSAALVVVVRLSN